MQTVRCVQPGITVSRGIQWASPVLKECTVRPPHLPSLSNVHSIPTTSSSNKTKKKTVSPARTSALISATVVESQRRVRTSVLQVTSVLEAKCLLLLSSVSEAPIRPIEVLLTHVKTVRLGPTAWRVK